jgi:hypothetical protein
MSASVLQRTGSESCPPTLDRCDAFNRTPRHLKAPV